MYELLGLAGFATLVSAGFAFWSAANVERLKSRFERERQQLSNLLQQELEAIRLESERIKSAYSLQIKKEYEHYESIYPLLVKTYYAITDTTRMDDEPTPLEFMLTEDELKESRQAKLSAASKGLAFFNEVEGRRPFIPTEVYNEVEAFGQMCIDTHFARSFPALKKPLGDGREIPEHSNEDFKRQLEAIAIAIKARLKVVDA